MINYSNEAKVNKRLNMQETALILRKCVPIKPGCVYMTLDYGRGGYILCSQACSHYPDFSVVRNKKGNQGSRQNEIKHHVPPKWQLSQPLREECGFMRMCSWTLHLTFSGFSCQFSRIYDFS